MFLLYLFTEFRVVHKYIAKYKIQFTYIGI